MSDRFKALKAKVKTFPTSPGVYVMRDEGGTIIYVGKAKSLKARTSSYFTGEKDIKTRFLVERAADIEAILTSTEYEALVLENNLIKRHSPRYNINLKDGKTYPVIRITNEKFPRVFRTRRIVKDGSQYFGPYPNIKAVDLYIELIHKLFPLRRCRILKKRESPCLYHHIGRCPAPCVGKISPEEYAKSIRKARALLTGRNAGFRKELEKRMKEESARLAFEKAAEYRDALKSLEILDAEPNVMDFKQESRDYIDYVASGRYVVFGVIQMRGGQVSGRELYVNEYAGIPSEALPEFLLQYYAETGREQPSRLFLPEHPGDLLERFFQESKGETPRIEIPAEKRDTAVQAMVRQNAGAELDRRIREEGDRPALEELQRVLNLPRLPRRIEGFDIAQLHGKHTVASLITFLDGRPDRAGYRHFKIRSTGGEVDDYKAIAEAVARRYQRLMNEEKPLPDLILVDGGKGQVSAALGVLTSLGLDGQISLAGLAKRDEEIWLARAKTPVNLPEGDPALRVLQHVRDETHRFATGHNQRLRSKDITLSTLEGVPGIGPSRSAKLIKTYKSLDGIYAQSAQDIAKTAGVAIHVAETLHHFLEKALESRSVGKEARDGSVHGRG
ncbi:MAG: excinuclease ABC subunit UvrC [Spirochaetales bacterium]|nr:excinuclease ABC subunit UvrC [Spirochaetales bacterium]